MLFRSLLKQSEVAAAENRRIQHNPMDGKWWASKPASSGGLCDQNYPCTWAQVKTNWPDASINGTLLFKAGGDWTIWKGNVDALTIGVRGQGIITFDF